MMMDPEKTNEIDQQQQLTDQRIAQFQEKYANNVRYEGSAWDMRLMFGVLDQAENVVQLHTSLRIPWVQAKLMVYYLRVHLALHEEVDGPVQVPDRLVPQPLATALPGLAAEEKAHDLMERMERFREEIFNA